MISPKRARLSVREEKRAYELATVRDNDTCQRCLRDCGPTARDHRKGRGVGGLTVVENLQVLGLRDHLWKTENPADAIRDGWAVPGWADPEEWPARRWLPTGNGTVRLSWVLYTPDGGFIAVTDSEAAVRLSGGV